MTAPTRDPRDDALSSPSSTGTDSVSDEGEWLDADNQDGEDEDAVAIISLVDDRVFGDALSMIAYCKESHGLDFLAIRDRLGLDFHGSVKLINFIRQRVHEGAALPAQIELKDLEDDRYLKPVLDDDALILCLDDLPEPAAAGAGAKEGEEDGGVPPPKVDVLLQKNAELQAQLEQLAKQFNNYRLAVQTTLDQRWEATDGPAAGGDAKSAAAGEVKKAATVEAPKEKADDSAYYFESYAHNDIHEVMLKDAVRTDAYRDFIYQNKHLFAGKVVLDIGCGTGILSMFCARAGAKQVIAVDNSNIIDKARENIFHNGLGSVITTVKGKIEEVVLPVQQVDIIVSEWMGYCLLYEAMLPSVIWARDRYLAPQGLLVPSHASIWMAPVADQEYVADHINFWRDVYGFDMKPMMTGIYTDARPTVLPASSVCGSSKGGAFRFLDLHTTTVEDLVFDAPWASTLNEGVDAADVDGFLVWFDCFFAQSRDDKTVLPTSTALEWASQKKDDGLVAFTTGPFSTETHWRQGLLLVDEKNKKKQAKAVAGGAAAVVVEGGEKKPQQISGRIQFITSEGHARGVDIKVTWGLDGSDPKLDQTWLLH